MRLRTALRLALWGEPVVLMSHNNMVAATHRAAPLILRWRVAGRLHELASIVKPEQPDG